MAKYIAKRILFAVFTLWAVVTITFVLMKLAPGSPFAFEGSMSQATYDNLMKHYNLDKPMIQQYFNYLVSVAKFDFGPSLTSATIDANYYITNGLPKTMQLGMMALTLSIVVGLSLGILAALNHNQFIDYAAVVLGIIGVSVPSFIMARILQTAFAGILPPANWNGFKYTILPTVTLAALPTAQITRLMRSSMLEVMNLDYIKTAKAKGVKHSNIIFKHAVRNAILPVVTSLGTVAANLLTGSFVVEKIFNIPGMGDALIKSIGNRDYPIIMAATVVYCIVLISITLIIDLLYPLIDPRIKIVGGGKNE